MILLLIWNDIECQDGTNAVLGGRFYSKELRFILEEELDSYH